MHMDTITIAGHEFDVPMRYAEGHTLKANEAKALNQTLAENLRNNFAPQVKAKIKEVLGKDKLDEDEALPSDHHEELQKALHAYAADYEFNVRSVGGGGGTPRDPVKAEALRMARKAIRAAIKAQGGDVKDYAEDSLEEAAKNLLETDSQYMETAQTIVSSRAAIASKKIELPTRAQ